VFFIVAFGMVFSSRFGVVVAQVVMPLRLIGFMGFFFVFARFVEFLRLLVVLGRFAKVISGFFVMIVCHDKPDFVVFT
jgi:hypothetical protein